MVQALTSLDISTSHVMQLNKSLSYHGTPWGGVCVNPAAHTSDLQNMWSLDDHTAVWYCL